MSTEKDPNGLDQHEAGAKLDSGKPRLSLVLGGFANALIEVGKVGTYGAAKYTDHGWKSVQNGIDRYNDAMLRHQLAELGGSPLDDETELLHAAHTAWNALARLELLLAARKKKAASDFLAQFHDQSVTDNIAEIATHIMNHPDYKAGGYPTQSLERKGAGNAK